MNEQSWVTNGHKFVLSNDYPDIEPTLIIYSEVIPVYMAFTYNGPPATFEQIQAGLMFYGWEKCQEDWRQEEYGIPA
jgi:hypothetical protein